MCSSMLSGCLGRGCHTRPSTSCLRQMHGISDGFTKTVKRYWLVARFTCRETSQTCELQAHVRQCSYNVAFPRDGVGLYWLCGLSGHQWIHLLAFVKNIIIISQDQGNESEGIPKGSGNIFLSSFHFNCITQTIFRLLLLISFAIVFFIVYLSF